MIRSQTRVEVLTAPNVRQGTFDDGRSWSVREVEVVDMSRNKEKVRLPDTLDMAAGKFYDVTLDSPSRKGESGFVRIVSAAEAK